MFCIDCRYVASFFFINILSYACARARIIIDIQTNHIPFFLAVSKNMSAGQNLTASSGKYTIRKKMNNESNTTRLLTPAYFSRRRHYLPVSDSDGERQQEENYLAKTFEPYKKREMSSGKCAILREKKNESNTAALLLTPAYFSRHYLRVSDSSGARQEEYYYYLPKMIEPCKNCENVRCINERAVVQTSCYCSEIIPTNYLSYTPSTDDIYEKMSAPQSDLPWS